MKKEACVYVEGEVWCVLLDFEETKDQYESIPQKPDDDLWLFIFSPLQN